MPLLAPGRLASLGICRSCKFSGSPEGHRGERLAAGGVAEQTKGLFVFHRKVLCVCGRARFLHRWFRRNAARLCYKQTKPAVFLKCNSPCSFFSHIGSHILLLRMAAFQTHLRAAVDWKLKLKQSQSAFNNNLLAVRKSCTSACF